MTILTYAGGALDRAGARRQDAAWLERQWASPRVRITPIWRGQNYFEIDEQGAPAPKGVCLGSEARPRLEACAAPVIFLGVAEAAPHFACDLSDLEEAAANALTGGGRFCDLRRMGPLLSLGEASLLAYARGMVHWNRTHRFCGACGHAAASKHGGHVRRCANPACGRDAFPRTDPAVIALVERPAADDRPAMCLLGRGREWPPDAFSTLAGFVEPGESLEEAVVREVYEEAGVRVDRAVYQVSQPWPFPASLMVGFRARATTAEIRVDGEELAEARWFTAADLRARAARGRPLSRPDSISNWLIESWLAEREARDHMV